jgi:hypothetical protein
MASIKASCIWYTELKKNIMERFIQKIKDTGQNALMMTIFLVEKRNVIEDNTSITG